MIDNWHAPTVAALVVALGACTNGSSSHETSSTIESANPPQSANPTAEPTPTADPPAASHPESAGSSDPRTKTGETRAANSAATPSLYEMSLAKPLGKVGVPVDVRYLISGVIAKDQPATVQLAFVPRVAGSNLQVQFPDTTGVTIDAGSRELRAQKATTSDVLRHSVLVTPTASDSGEMRAIVSMDFDGGRYFSIFTIPVGASPEAAAKRVPKD